jgi:hypothetical protein
MAVENITNITNIVNLHNSNANYGNGLACRFSSKHEIAMSGDGKGYGVFTNPTSPTRIFSTGTGGSIPKYDQIDFEFNSSDTYAVNRNGNLQLSTVTPNTTTTIFTDNSTLSTVSVGRLSQYFAAAGVSKKLFIFNFTNKNLIYTFSNFNDAILSVKLSPDEKSIITGDNSG